MRKLLKSWVFWVFVAPLLILGAVVLARLESSNHICRCGSRLTERYWRLPNGRVFFLPEVESRSGFYEDILVDHHAHDWELLGARLDLPGESARKGETPVSYVAFLYGEVPEFAAWLREKVAAGGISAISLEWELSKRGYYPSDHYPFGWTRPPRPGS